MKLVVLIENTAPEGSGLQAEHGLSLYLEYGGKRLLLDAGESGAFADNADKLGVEIDGRGALEIAARSRGTPRIANNLLRRVRDYAQVRADNRITGEVADRALALLE